MTTETTQSFIPGKSTFDYNTVCPICQLGHGRDTKMKNQDRLELVMNIIQHKIYSEYLQCGLMKNVLSFLTCGEMYWSMLMWLTKCTLLVTQQHTKSNSDNM